ncbi:MAG: glycosyltransferase 87 family protein [Actinomycetota bacterium]|nr:glycosyltransferase 87 family protein [Actinomycetota bacterium]
MSALAGARRIDGGVRLGTGIRTTGALGSLAAVTCGSWWIAAGAAASPHWLELPTGMDPAWIQGPLHAFGGLLGSLPSAALSGALVLLLAGYVGALLCARTISLRLALAAVALADLAFTLGPSLVSTDVFGYLAYAREAVQHGLNPYVSAPISLHGDAILPFVYWKHQPSPYGPLFTLGSAPLGLLTPAAGLWLYKALAGLAAFGLALVVADIARARQLHPARAVIFVGLNPIVLVYALSGAHNDLIAALLVAGAVAMMLRGRDGGAAATGVAAAGVKVTLGLALPFVLIASRRRPRAARGAALALVALGLPTLALFGTPILDQLHRIAADPLFDTVWSGPDRLAALLSTHIDSAVRLSSTLAAAAVTIWMIVRARRGADPLTAAGWAFLALIASIASLAPWYLVWLLPLAAVGRSRALWAATLLVTLYLVAVHLPALGGRLWLSSPQGVSARPVAQVDQCNPSRRSPDAQLRLCRRP